MAHRFESVVINEKALDEIVHRFTINGHRGELTDNLLERMNTLMAANRWYAAGEVIPLDRDEFSENFLYFDCPQELRSCRFERRWLDSELSVLAIAELTNYDQKAIVNVDELCTSNGIPFDELFIKSFNGTRIPELPRFQMR